MDRRPTIIDVAKRAGVSKSTVSLVLQNSPLIRETTHIEVRKAMAELGYVYNRAAATLRSSNAGLIGLVINDMRNPFFTEFATSLQMAISARGYAAVVANTDEDPELQAQVVSAMIEHGVDALILSPAYGNEAATFDPIRRAGIPAMQVLRRVVEDGDLFPFAAPDYAGGGRLATQHLIDLGAKRIAFVGGLTGRAVTQERMSGYLASLEEAGLEPFPMLGRASRAFGREAAIRLTSEHPGVTAAICFNDLVALGMLAGFAQIGRNVGPEFQLVGFDDIEECSQSWPSLTTVHCGIAGFGEWIAATVLAWLEEGSVPPPVSRTTVEIVIRDSTRTGS